MKKKRGFQISDKAIKFNKMNRCGLGRSNRSIK